jgi:hypothetical protein
MVKKKGTKKKVAKKKVLKKKIPLNNGVNNKLIENFVSLQKVMTNMSIKFDNLSNQISKLLDLFEISAKSLAKKEIKIISENNKESTEINKKVDDLLEQNKLIAKGITIIHEKTNPFNRFINPIQNKHPNSPESLKEESKKENIKKDHEKLFHQHIKEKKHLNEEIPHIKRGKDLFERSILSNSDNEEPIEKKSENNSPEKTNIERFKKLPKL